MHQLQKELDVSHLFFNGDIFDFWVSDHLFFQAEFEMILREVDLLQKSRPIQMVYFEGNHDLHLQEFWQNQMKFSVYQSRKRFEIDGLRLVVEHGDEINRMDKGYLFLRWLLRTPLLTFAAHRLPSSWVEFIGRRLASASRQYTSEIKIISESDLQSILHDHAKELFQEEPFDFHIHGHVHVRDEFVLPTRQGSTQEISYSINLGTWLTAPGYLEIETKTRKYRWVEL